MKSVPETIQKRVHATDNCVALNGKMRVNRRFEAGVLFAK